MALLLSEIKMPLDAQISELSGLISAQFCIPRECVQAVRLVRQSIDARRKNDIHLNISAVVQTDALTSARLIKSGDRRVEEYRPLEGYELKTGKHIPPGRIAVVGLGPAGIFAAYLLAQAGYNPLVIEKGRDVERRKADVEAFFHGGPLDTSSNIAFGEGGAGTFSDGKLTSRSKDPRTEVVLSILREHGAPDDISYQAKPHIGTDRLQSVISGLSKSITDMGGELRFETAFVDFSARNDRLTHITLEKHGIRERVECAALILATGHSADDIYDLLHSRGVELSAKPFAVGLRVEHPQRLIDRAQFGALAGHPRLGAAEYRLTAKSGGRGVYTFCMCPGGEVVAAATQPGGVVTNGMSSYARDGGNANSAILVQVGPEDFGYEPLSGLRFRRALEERAYKLGGGDFIAPAQRMEDFLMDKAPSAFKDIKPTYLPGVLRRRLSDAMPQYIVYALKEGIKGFSRQLRGFDYIDAILTGVESRSSSPVRINRCEGGEAQGLSGLYPAGEGAGYAGGIMSAAIDGMRAAEHVAANYAPLSKH